MYFILQGGGFQPAKRSNLSENDTDDSDGLGEFSLTKLAVKSRQQKKVEKMSIENNFKKIIIDKYFRTIFFTILRIFIFRFLLYTPVCFHLHLGPKPHPRQLQEEALT